MGSDGLVELDQEWWTAFATFNLVPAAVFGLVALTARATVPSQTLLIAENGALALPFGGLQTSAWLTR